MKDEPKNPQRECLAQEALRRLPKTNTASLDCIRKTLRKDTLLYLPLVDTRDRFVNEWLMAFSTTVIVSTNMPVLRRSIATTMDNMGENLVRLLVSLDEFVCKSFAVPAAPFAFLFEGASKGEEIEAVQAHPLYKLATIKCHTTPNPILFTRFLAIASSDPECYTSTMFLKTSHYRSLIETSEFFYFDNSAARLEGLKGQVAHLPLQETQLANFLIDRGLFHSGMFTETVVISDKLHCLLRITELITAECLMVYLEDEIEECIMHELLKMRLGINEGTVKERVREIVEQYSGGTGVLPARAYSNVIERPTAPLRVQFTRDPNYLKGVPHPLVLFSFCSISAPTRIFVLPETSRTQAREFAIDDSNMARAYTEYMRKRQASQQYILPAQTAPCRFELLTRDLEGVRQNVRDKAFIYGVGLEGMCVRVTARCSIGKIPTCFNLQTITGEPVVIPRAAPDMPCTLFSNKVELCTLTTPKTLCNSKPIRHNGYLMMNARGIVVFSFTKDRNLMIEVDSADLEDYVLVETIKRPQDRVGVFKTYSYGCIENNTKHSETTVGEYLDLIAGLETPRETIVLSFCLKNRPRVFTVAQSIEIASEIINSSPITEKCKTFLSLEWRRLSASEFTDHEERFDLRVSLPCFQDIQPELLERFIFQTRDFCNLTGDRLAEQVSLAMKNTHLSGILGALSSYPVKVVATEMAGQKGKAQRETSTLSLSKIEQAFFMQNFDDFYAVASLLSRKGRHLLSKVTTADLEFIASQSIPAYCGELDRVLSGRFREVNLREIRVPSSETRARERTVVITPLSIVLGYEVAAESNRVLRHFDPDKFCRVTIREEGGREKFSAGHSHDTEGVYDCFRRLMLNGLVVGPRKYFFLTTTMSQLRGHSSWFVTPYEKDGVMIGADYIKAWIGNFNMIKNIGKYAVRIGQALSSTTPTVEFDNVVEISDIIRGTHCFTDGIGLMNKRSAGIVSQRLGLSFIPSAFQVRFGGYKGVLAVHPWMDDPKAYEAWTESNFINIVEASSTENKTNTAPRRPDIIFRSSMNKFQSIHNNLEVVSTPKSSPFYLNRQIILVLEGLGVPVQVFIDLQDEYIRALLVQLAGDFPSFIKRFAGAIPNITSDLPFHRKLQMPIVSKVFEELNSKAKILVRQGRGGMGVLDELGVLGEDEVFFMIRKEEGEIMDGLRDYGSYAVPYGHCIVAKNPVTHPGDIRTVRCVDVPQLHYMRDVVVFSKRGDRPVFNQCSGSDLDGDIFLVSWCRALLPKATFKPYSYVDTCALVKESVLLSDIINFFIRHMKHYQLGRIAHAYLATADRLAVFSEKALRLAEVFNKNIDYVKTGQIVAIPEDLVPDEYPDFMERTPSYHSTKALGYLYRRSTFDLSGIGSCECRSCSLREIQEQQRWRSFVLLGAGVKTREVPTQEEFSNEYYLIYDSYVSDVKLLMDKAQVRSEEELFCSGDGDGCIKQELRHLSLKYSEILKDKNALKMAKICECKEFTGILGLCGNAYKLKNLVRKGIVREGSSSFVFNSKILLCSEGIPVTGSSRTASTSLDGASMCLNWEVENFYQNGCTEEHIRVNCDVDRYREFFRSLDVARRDLFGDLFNLILLGELYRIDEVDQILDVLMKISQEMKESTAEEILRVGIPGSNDKLFRILCLLPLDLSLVKKAQLLKEKALVRFNAREKEHKTCRRLGLIISGMQDENEDIEFVGCGSATAEASEPMVPRLRNKGICSIDYYKDTVRDFLINILYSNESLKTLEGGGAHFEVCFTPGRFFFTGVPETHMNDRFSVKSLERMVSRGELESGFINIHKALGPDRIEFLRETMGLKRSVKETLSFTYKGSRFDVEREDDRLVRVAKDRKILGRVYLVKEDCDTRIELFRRMVAHDEGGSALGEDEKFMQERLFRSVDQGYMLIFDQIRYPCLDIKLERSTVFSSKSGFAISHRELFTGEGPLESRGRRTSCYVLGEFSLRSIEGFRFDRIFRGLWRVYRELGLLVDK